MSLRPQRVLHPMRGSVRVQPPVDEPVSAIELRANLLMEVKALPDEEAESLIQIAREVIEEDTGIAMISQGWRMSLDQWPGGREQWWDGVRQMSITELNGGPCPIALPAFPLQSVDVVTVFDEADSGTVVDVSTTFNVDVYQKPGRMALKDGAAWPVALRNINAIQIEYTAGYGDSPENVPAALRRSVLQMASYLFEHRGDGCSADDAYVKSGAAALASRYKSARI